MWQHVVTALLEIVGSKLVLTSFLTFLKVLFFLRIYPSVSVTLNNFESRSNKNNI